MVSQREDDSARPATESAPQSTRDPALESLADTLFEAEKTVSAESPPRRPRATYRLQLHQGFPLEAVERLVDYLADLGISDAYFSPYLAAKPGSTHGYDVFDHGKINEEIGDKVTHQRLVDKMKGLGMGRVLDVVPNHMGIAGGNPFWLDVLENGPQAPSARFFDIDWSPVKEELEGRVLLPILEDQYGKVLEAGKLELTYDNGGFFIHYYENRLPLSPRSYAQILVKQTEELAERLGSEDIHLLEYRSIISSIHNLPPRDATDAESVQQYTREKEVIKHRLARVCDEAPALREFLEENVASFAGTPGEPHSFDPLHELLELQVYRLAFWRVAAEEINYRRFFDINDLAGLRTEDPVVFQTIHDLIFRWVDEGGVSALRIDHPDGLADPFGYFAALQETLFLRACQQRLKAEHPEVDWMDVVDRVHLRYKEAIAQEPQGPLARRFPIVVEKILSRGEDLPEAWPIDGTVGYEYLNALNGLFIDPTSQESIDSAYVDFTDDRKPFAELVYEAKSLITRASLASEINMLARIINRVSEHDRRSRDFTLNDLRRATREIIACFPVYRTYLRPDDPVHPRDQGYIEQAVYRARRRNPTTDASVFAFIMDALLLKHPEDISDEDRILREVFVTRFQQTTGPVTAKGVEDTSFYRHVRLIALNEVGGDPGRFGSSPSTFHAINSQRLAHWPGTFSTSATHDNKRGEDTRIRIDAISEFAEEWSTRLTRWSRWHARKKTEVHGTHAPDPREEYMLYQILLGAWPFGGPEEAVPEGFASRVQEYMLKAVREAKVNTSWTDTDSSYGDAIVQFVAEILEGPDSAVFLKDLLPFQRRLSRIGIVHSLAQALLKVASPGVPDIYQGCDLWDLSLVDPDNRRPVDYDARKAKLAQIRAELESGTTRADLAARLFAAPEDGSIKLYLLWTTLNHRKEHPELYMQGTYRALEAEGDQKGHVVAFGRSRNGDYAIAVAPRLVAPLMGEEATTPPIGSEVWKDTRLTLPDTGLPTRWRNLLTDEVTEVQTVEDHPSIPLAEVFRTLPFALLVEQGT